MNNLYFACATCKSYVDAGYRWAYWGLQEPGLVARGVRVSVPLLLAATEYWKGAAEVEWLNKLLPQVRLYLVHHQRHDLLFGEKGDFLPDDDETQLQWINEAGFVIDLTPRYFAEKLGYTSWEQVSDHLAKESSPPGWWLDPVLVEQGKLIFSRATGLQGA